MAEECLRGKTQEKGIHGPATQNYFFWQLSTLLLWYLFGIHLHIRITLI